jgi:hypothetical protein
MKANATLPVFRWATGVDRARVPFAVDQLKVEDERQRKLYGFFPLPDPGVHGGLMQGLPFFT